LNRLMVRTGGRGGDLDQAGGFGSRPVRAGPMRAGGGIEIGERPGKVGMGAQPAVGAGRAGIAGDEIDIGLELLRDEAGGGVGGFLRRLVGHAIEAGEHRHAEPVVDAVALDLAAVGARDRLDRAVERALHQRIGEAVAGVEQGRFPAEREMGAARGEAEGIGRLLGEPDQPARLADRGPLGDGAQEGRLLLAGPAADPLGRGLGVFVERQRGDFGVAMLGTGKELVMAHRVVLSGWFEDRLDMPEWGV
jgi:hypothetical protein